MARRDEGGTERSLKGAGADGSLLSAAGVGAGAVLGGILRGGLALYHLGAFTATAASTTGAMRRAWLGAVVGGAVSLGLYYLLLPLVMFLQVLKVGTVARPVEALVIGAIAGGLGAALGARRARSTR